MKKYLLLHYGFEKPTPEIMEAWGAWFRSVADKTVDQGGFTGGREISNSGTRELPWDLDCITGYGHRGRRFRRSGENRKHQPVHLQHPDLRVARRPGLSEARQAAWAAAQSCTRLVVRDAACTDRFYGALKLRRLFGNPEN